MFCYRSFDFVAVVRRRPALSLPNGSAVKIERCLRSREEKLCRRLYLS